MLQRIIVEAGYTLETVLTPDRGVKAPEGEGGLLIMGGPQSANDTHLPYIRDELNLLQRLIPEGFPVLGICLGAQLMAKALGGEITPAPVAEYGWMPVFPTAIAPMDPAFRSLPTGGLHVFQWHSETFSLPAGTSLLASGDHVPNQAFRFLPGQYGLQFHVEVDEPIIASWLKHAPDQITQERTLLAETRKHLPAAKAFCTAMASTWLAHVQDKDGRGSP